MDTDQSEAQTMFDELCEELDGVLPDEILSMAKEVQPIEDAIRLLWNLGGRIRTTQPGIKLYEPYSYPAEVENLNDEVYGYSFKIASFPLEVLAKATTANINADEEIITSLDLENYVPIIIKEGENVRYIALIDYSDRRLELPLDCDLGFNMNIELPESSEEQKEAMDISASQFAENLEALKEKALKAIKPFNNEEDEEAITAWCEKHSYKYAFVVRCGIDIYH